MKTTIHIQKSHKGALHRWLGVAPGTKLSGAQIARATHSSDPHVRKMGYFAKNAAKFQH